jgi:hypothetical protein
MCVIVTVGIAGFCGDATAPFHAAGFTTEPAINSTAEAVPRDALRIGVTAGGCSCSLYCGDTAERPDPDAERRRYARKGWSQPKIERAVEASRLAHRNKSSRIELHAQFAAAIETLAKQGARVTLLAHMFSGSFRRALQDRRHDRAAARLLREGRELLPRRHARHGRRMSRRLPAHLSV